MAIGGVVIVMSLAAALLSQEVVAQPARERQLVDAIADDPANIRRYVDLSDFYAKAKRTNDADRVLRDALATIDPLSTAIYERRIRLFLDPFRPQIIGAIVDEWLGVDGTSPVTASLAAGDRLRKASGARGDGTDEAARQIDMGMRVIDGALPGNPDVAMLRLVRSNLLMAQAALVTDPSKQRALIADAQQEHRRAGQLQQASEAPPFGGPLAPVVAAMTRMPPFGPPGAMRAGALVPEPRVIDYGPRLPPTRRTRGPSVPLEVVVGPDGRVTQVYAPQSVDGYDRALAGLVQHRVYEPTLVNGHPVSVILRVLVNEP